MTSNIHLPNIYHLVDTLHLKTTEIPEESCCATPLLIREDKTDIVVRSDSHPALDSPTALQTPVVGSIW